MRKRVVRNVLVAAMFVLAAVNVRASFNPEEFAQTWSCTTGWTERLCPATAELLKTGYHFTGCSGAEDRCVDNEAFCVNWCFELRWSLDDCFGRASGCFYSWPGNSACDSMAGTMECECGYVDWCFDRQ